MKTVLCSIASLALVTLAGCVCDTPVRPLTATESITFEPGPYDSRISPAAGGILAKSLAPPVYRLVHTPTDGSAKLTYLAMCAPWKPSSTNNAIRTLDIRFLTQKTAISAAPDLNGVLQPHASLLGSATPAPVSTATEYNASYVNVVSGYGWIYLTGSRPMVKTRLVVGGSNGTTYVVQIGMSGTTEYHRFALLVPPSTESATVDLALATAPGTIVATITKEKPYIVFYSSTSGIGTVVNTGPQAAIGTGPIWDNFQAAINDAVQEAVTADLPVP